MIQLKNIHITFGEKTVLERKAIKGISLNIQEGDFITVIGSNGAGKSTLLNSIAGDVELSKGSIFIDEENVTFKKSYERSHVVSRVFQDPLIGTCGNLTIAENMALAIDRGQKRFFKNALSKERKHTFQNILKDLKLGLEDRLDTDMSLLSGGQRQAISLLMATLSSSKILLLDEHTSALDPKTADFILKLTQKIVQEKSLTTLMVTHSLQQALSIGNRTIVLHNGKLIYDVSGKERENLTIEDLLAHFGKNVDDDRLLLQTKNP